MNLIVADHLAGQQLETVILPHPRTGDDCLFLKSEESVYEAVKFSRQIGCLFVGDVVVPDTSINVITAVDPLFLLLPRFIKNQKEFHSLSDLFENESNFLSVLAQKSCDVLHMICDTEDVDGDKYYRFSIAKAMDWLQSKIDAVTAVLDRKAVITSTRSVGMDQLKFLGKVDSNRSDQARYACSLLEDYLPPEVAVHLRKHLKIPDSVVQTPRDAVQSGGSASGGKELPKEDYFVDPKYGMKIDEQKLTRAQKQLAKVDKKGIRPITSFFTSKPK